MQSDLAGTRCHHVGDRFGSGSDKCSGRCPQRAQPLFASRCPIGFNVAHEHSGERSVLRQRAPCDKCTAVAGEALPGHLDASRSSERIE
jgi:hypothetical protein